MTAILLLGANGQVGYELRKTLPVLGKVLTLDVPEINFCQPESLRALLRKRSPKIIINAAAYTAVDKAETDRDAAFAVNAHAPMVLAQEAEALGALLVHYSTDYVFDGVDPEPRIETDLTAPLSVYGRSKLDGELAVDACSRHLTFRTSWVFGSHGHNFVKTILRLATDREMLEIVADQIGAPTGAPLIAETTRAILAEMKDIPAGDRRWGLYHLVASGETSWHGLARYVVQRASEMGLPLRTTPEAVLAITSDGYAMPAKRPASSRLDTSRIRSVFGVPLPHWKIGVEAVLALLVKEMRS